MQMSLYHVSKPVNMKQNIAKNNSTLLQKIRKKKLKTENTGQNLLLCEDIELVVPVEL